MTPGMAEQGFGRVVFLSSVSAERGGGVFGGAAAAAKAAQLGFRSGPRGRTARHHRQLRRTGLIDTDITGGALEGDTKTSSWPASRSAARGQVNDVADLITYLCREQTGYITGATYDINGGSHIH